MTGAARNVTKGRSVQKRAASPEPKISPRTLKKREAQDRVLALLAQGHTVEDCMEAVSRRREVFYQWCQREPWFKDRSDAIRSRQPDAKVSPFRQFRKDYFGFETPWHQEKITRAIEAAKPRSITMILLPPGAGKTSVLEDYICYLLGPVNPNTRISVLSETRDHARKVLRRVALRMTDTALSPAYIRGYGPFRPADREVSRPWNADVLTLVTAQHDERDYSLEVRSAGSAIYGARYDLIILDDFQSVRSLNSTDKLIEYFRQDVFTRAFSGANQGKIIIIGTRVGPDDFYERLLKEDMVDELVQIPALDEDGNSYWPPTHLEDGSQIGFSEDDLGEIRKIVGEETWARVYMQRPQSKHGQTFSDQMTEEAKNLSRGVDPKEMRRGVYRIASLDPAIAGWAVFKVADITFDKMYLLYSQRIHDASRYETLWDALENISAVWRPDVWVIEGNAIQGGLLRSDRVQDMEKRYGFRTVAHQTGKNKQDDIIGVASMAGSFLRHEIDIPWGTLEAQEMFQPMIDELHRWRPDIPTKQLRQDEVMALWFLYIEWQRTKSQLASRIDTRIQRRGLPYSPTRYSFAKAG
ncbi:MAG: hypothetical protein KGL39_53640 [Patescibacteria group bacterium]|nr:hypothetical protein [Patescibacteria group bacterium]